ncbi:MAG TPA: NADH-quinone oxidoreductase subunit N, partial [Dehalococcoidales bacterium]|nr:NADH-quinone oxidoreductase subunit N [Dehalococcoidales bacterium]
LPELTLLVTAVVVILLDLFLKQKWVLAAISIAGIAVSAGFAVAMWGGDSESIFFGMMAVDNFAIFFKLLFLVIAALVILASTDYVSKLSRFRGEYYALVLISALGMMLMAAATELISIYISLELTSISLYILVGFLKDPRSTESALKYLLLGAVASAVLLFGMALIFGFTGQTQLGDIAAAIQSMSLSGVMSSPGLIAGIVLIIAGFGFKIAAVPFHMWVPDVYEGAPTPVTAYLSVASKAAGFAILLRVFFSAFSFPTWLSLDWGMVFAILAAVGMTVGNIVALTQTNIKRMLGYSSIAQAGYLMVGLATVGFVSPILSDNSVFAGQSGLLFFLASYALTNLGAFTAIIAISGKVDSDLIKDYTGMGKRAPLLALALSLCLISLIGMPPAAGFMAKFYIFSGAAQHGLLWLVIIAVINSVISAYYYLRVVKVMWTGQPASETRVPSSIALRVALALSCLGVLALGIVPGFVMKLAEMAAKIFVP